MRLSIRHAACAALAALLLAGCGPNPDGAREDASADAAGPRARLGTWHGSLVGGDKRAYLECFVGAEDELVLALAVFDAIQASYEFHRAIVSTYGPEAWQVFQGAKGARVDLYPRDATWLEGITVVRTGGLAFGYLPKGRVPMHLMADGGAWRIHAASLVPPGFDAKRSADHLFRWAATLRHLIPQITNQRLAAERATKDVQEDFKSRLAPDEQPAAAASLDAFLTF